MDHEVVILILAAGASRRMGQPKALLRLDGAPLVRRAVQAARDSGARALVVLGARGEAVRAALAEGDPVDVVVNSAWEDGMGASIACGAAMIGDEVTHIGVMTVDQPDIDAAHLRALLDACAPPHSAAATPTSDGAAGVPALFHRAHLPALRALTGDQGARAILRDPSTRVALVPARCADDIDAPQAWRDYLEARDGSR